MIKMHLRFSIVFHPIKIVKPLPRISLCHLIPQAVTTTIVLVIIFKTREHFEIEAFILCLCKIDLLVKGQKVSLGILILNTIKIVLCRLNLSRDIT